MSSECCSKCRLYHSDYQNVLEYSKRDVCWRCRCHGEKTKRSLTRDVTKFCTDRSIKKPFEKSLGLNEKEEEQIDYYTKYNQCDQDYCGNINCGNIRHDTKDSEYIIKSGYQPYVESLKKNQITFQVKLIPCTELFQSFKARDIFSDEIIDNLKSTYNQRKDLNHAIVDLLLIYGEKFVYSFSRSLKDGGQIELYELLENEAERIKIESGYYVKNAKNEESFSEFYEYIDKNEEDENIKQKILERSKSYYGQSSSRINDSWALLLDLEKKEQKIHQLNKVNIENEQMIRELRERLKCRGKQMDEDRKNYKENLKIQHQINKNAENTIKNLEEKLKLYDENIEVLNNGALETLRFSENFSNEDEKYSLEKSSSMDSNENSYMKLMTEREVFGTSNAEQEAFYEFEKNLNGCEGMEKKEIIQNLATENHEKLAKILSYLIEGNKKRIFKEKECEKLKNERREMLIYLQSQLDTDSDDFEQLVGAFINKNNDELKKLNELENKMESMEGTLNVTRKENKQMRELKKQNTLNLRSTKDETTKLNFEKYFLKGVILSLKHHAAQNDKRLFPRLNTVTTRPYIEDEFL